MLLKGVICTPVKVEKACDLPAFQLDKVFGNTAAGERLGSFVAGLARFHECLRDSFAWLQLLAKTDLQALTDMQVMPHPFFTAVDAVELKEVCGARIIADLNELLNSLVVKTFSDYCASSLPACAHKVADLLSSKDSGEEACFVFDNTCQHCKHRYRYRFIYIYIDI